MKDKGYAIFGLGILAIAAIYTIYTLFVIYDISIRINTQTIIYYFMAFCFVTSVVYRYKERKGKQTIPKPNTMGKENPYPDSLFN